MTIEQEMGIGIKFMDLSPVYVIKFEDDWVPFIVLQFYCFCGLISWLSVGPGGDGLLVVFSPIMKREKD